MKFSLFFLFFICILFFSGCFKKASLKDDPATAVSNQKRSFFQSVLEAKLNDVPLPSGLKLLENCVVENALLQADVIIGYVVIDYTVLQLTDFFCTEMERYGWRQVAFFTTHDPLLIFDRPGRICVILIMIDEYTKSGELWIREGPTVWESDISKN